MPCWEVNTVSLAFNAKNINIMMEVFKDMGINAAVSKDQSIIRTSIGVFDLRSGKVEVEQRDARKVNDFRIKYSEKVVSIAAKKKKWLLQKKKNTKQRVFVAQKW